MKRIVFYVATEWAVGSIHHELTKYLWAYNIDASVLPWINDYSAQEIQELSNQIDLFVSLPSGVAALIDWYGIPPEKCIAMAHATVDLDNLSIFSNENKARLHGYAVVSNWLAEQSRHWNIGYDPIVVPVGINYNKFYAPVGSQLRTIGFAGTYTDQLSTLKRGHLVHLLAEQTGLNFTVAQTYHHSYVTMPGYYPTVDCVIIASTQEGAGLPALEAGAAGRLVITTPVGHYSKIDGNGGHVVPIEEEEFLNATRDLLTFYKNDSEAYRAKCQAAQEHARSYDWSNVIEQWVELVK